MTASTAVHCPSPGAEIICLWGLVKSIQSQCRINGYYTFPGSTEEGWVISDNTKIESKWTPESMLPPVPKLKSDKKMRKAIIVNRGRSHRVIWTNLWRNCRQFGDSRQCL